jgi:hypothetical protein
MRQIVPQDIVADQMHRPVAEHVQPIQRGIKCAPFVNQHGLTPHRSKGKQPGRFGIDLQIDRDAGRQERRGVKGQTSGIRIARASKGFQAIDNSAVRIRKPEVSAAGCFSVMAGASRSRAAMRPLRTADCFLRVCLSACPTVRAAGWIGKH